MNSRLTFLVSAVTTSITLGALAFCLPEAAAQNPQMEQKVAEIKQASAANKQALGRYTWQEQQVVKAVAAGMAARLAHVQMAVVLVVPVMC